MLRGGGIGASGDLGGGGGAAAAVVPLRALVFKTPVLTKKAEKVTPPPELATTAESLRLFYSTDQRRELRKRKRGMD
jgi:hypothetical protein